MKIFKLFLLVTLFTLPAIITYSNETGIYGIPVFDYVTGRFIPASHPYFVNLDNTSIPAARKNMYLRQETAKALEAMLADFSKENPGIKIWVQSATRNFQSQRNIWDGKWAGRIRTTGTSDINKITDPLERAKLILRYSSMPGTSRHHWGTDFDINLLNNSYYEKGEGAVIYNWLVNNAGRYGFFKPYTSGRDSGYEEEKWHWSYLPLSGKFLHDWNRLYKNNPGAFNSEKLYSGSEHAGHLAPIYVNSINRECR